MIYQYYFNLSDSKLKQILDDNKYGAIPPKPIESALILMTIYYSKEKPSLDHKALKDELSGYMQKLYDKKILASYDINDYKTDFWSFVVGQSDYTEIQIFEGEIKK